MSSKITDAEFHDIMTSFSYIENVRSFGEGRRGGKRRIPKTQCTDLYYVGAYFVRKIRTEGSKDQRDSLAQFLLTLPKL